MPSSPAAERHEPLRANRVRERDRASAEAGPAREPGRLSPVAGWLASAILTTLLAGCGGGPAPRLYVLEPAATRAAPLTDTFDTLGTSVVTLPSYVRDGRIASRDAGTGVSLDDENRWAEEPEEAITRVLLDSLRRHGGGSVLLEPYPRDFEPEARIEIAFDRLLRTASGGVDASGRILLLSGDGRRLVDVLPFELDREAASRSPSAFFTTLSVAIDELARTALERLRTGPAA